MGIWSTVSDDVGSVQSTEALTGIVCLIGAPAQIQPRWGCMHRGCGVGTAAYAVGYIYIYISNIYIHIYIIYIYIERERVKERGRARERARERENRMVRLTLSAPLLRHSLAGGAFIRSFRFLGPLGTYSPPPPPHQLPTGVPCSYVHASS